MNSGFFAWRRSAESDPKTLEVRLELFGRLEDDSGHAKALSRLRVVRNIVNINGFLGAHVAGFEGRTVDERVRLARTYAVGIDTGGEEAKEREADLFQGHVDGVGIRK